MMKVNFKGKEFADTHHLPAPFRLLVLHTRKGIVQVALDGSLILHGNNLHAQEAAAAVFRRDARGKFSMATMSEKDLFQHCYYKSMIVAGIGFSVADAIQISVISITNDRPSGIALSAVITLLVYSFIQFVVFLLIGIVAAYAPARILEIAVRRTFKKNYMLLSIGCGVLLGAVFIPLCAGVPYALFHAPDLPSYASRCKEFVLPMIFAGCLGGYTFWPCSDSRNDD